MAITSVLITPDKTDEVDFPEQKLYHFPDEANTAIDAGTAHHIMDVEDINRSDRRPPVPKPDIGGHYNIVVQWYNSAGAKLATDSMSQSEGYVAPDTFSDTREVREVDIPANARGFVLHSVDGSTLVHEEEINTPAFYSALNVLVHGLYIDYGNGNETLVADDVSKDIVSRRTIVSFDNLTDDSIEPSYLNADSDAQKEAFRTRIGAGTPSSELADGSIDTDLLADGAVTTPKLADDAVTHAKMANHSVGTNQLIDGGISTPKISSQAVTTGKIVDMGVTTAKLDDGAVTGAKLAVNAVARPTEEEVFDHVKNIIVGGTNITATDDDADNTITLAGQAGGGGLD